MKFMMTKREQMNEYLEKVGSDIGEFMTNWDVSNKLALAQSKAYQIMQDMNAGKIDWVTAKEKLEKYIEDVIEMYGDFESLALGLEDVVCNVGELDYDF